MAEYAGFGLLLLLNWCVYHILFYMLYFVYHPSLVGFLHCIRWCRVHPTVRWAITRAPTDSICILRPRWPIWKRGRIRRVRRCMSIQQRSRMGRKLRSMPSTTPNEETHGGAFSARTVTRSTLLLTRWDVSSVMIVTTYTKQTCGTQHTSEHNNSTKNR